MAPVCFLSFFFLLFFLVHVANLIILMMKEVGSTESTVHILEQKALSCSLAFVHSIPSWLVWAEDVQVDSSQC